MSAPIDLLSGAQLATVKLLRNQLPADQREIVRHSLKQGTQPPFHLIGDIDTANDGDKGEQLEAITVDVHTVYRGGDRAELLAMMHQVRLATDGAKVDLGGASYRFHWDAAAASTAAADGVTYAGITSLILTAEPA
ncbi:hypothetical protein [uncultured Sphingomonas sp.]|uniref:hypothetical protein n=1 Tax=uncultured Sphingomonas sp. TaxID=158754 RepID=UPI002590D14D|nr:hypothetical protein [uncultured Sphingomonas sp.]